MWEEGSPRCLEEDMTALPNNTVGGRGAGPHYMGMNRNWVWRLRYERHLNRTPSSLEYSIQNFRLCHIGVSQFTRFQSST